MKKQPELTAMTRKKLIDTYFELTAKGEKATVGAITGQAGYNRCTFYRYFTDTEQLLSQVETEICDAFRAALPDSFSAEISLEIIESFAEIYRKYDRYLSVLLGRYGDICFISRMKEIMYPMAKQILAVNSDSEAVMEIKAELVLSAVLAAVTKWYELDQPVSAEQLGMMMKEIFQKGIFMI